MTKFRILSIAAQDLANAMEYYETKSVGMGGGFLDEYERRPLHNLPKFVLIMP
jgi:hypothetical protein